MLPRKVAYLNCAYMAPQLKRVENAGIKGMKQKRHPYKVGPDAFFHDTETLRRLFAEIISVNEPERIVIIPSVSYGMANVANNISLKKGEKIIVAGEQFPSNVYPWMRLCQKYEGELKIVAPPEVLTQRAALWNEQLLASIDSSTRVVALGHVHWADGSLFDLAAIRKKTHEVGALMIIDGTQSVGALPFSVKELAPDALVCAGYKWLMGPYSIGLAYYGPAFDTGVPIEENWINRFESENFGGLVNYKENYQPGALRYEVGEHSNFILLPMLIAAVKQIRYWGVENIQQYCEELIAPYLQEIVSAGYHIEDEQYRGAHLFGIRPTEGQDMDLIRKKFHQHKVHVSVRGSAIRIAPNVYNDQRDMERLLRALKETT